MSSLDSRQASTVDINPSSVSLHSQFSTYATLMLPLASTGLSFVLPAAAGVEALSSLRADFGAADSAVSISVYTHTLKPYLVDCAAYTHHFHEVSFALSFDSFLYKKDAL
eukprot:GHVR01071968.1.p3 GENE.GHVR01071968.1~~GHVR01071968.1.p3  ORF type:complete len:110 (-),score=8.06 GHVR01071968.1:229-558(-)